MQKGATIVPNSIAQNRPAADFCIETCRQANSSDDALAGGHQ